MYAIRLSCLAVPAMLLTLGGAVSDAQPEATPSVLRDSTSTTQVSMTLLRDSFIQRVKAAGFTCKLEAPTILVDDVPSFGQYDSSKNTLRTSDWSLLNPREMAFFTQLAGPGADQQHIRQLFEIAAHQYIFIHELGHWWQACAGGNAHRGHYETELGANRIALAYWREVDPKVVATMVPIFRGVVDHVPSPVPADQSVESYFNANYQALGPSPAYPWFMSRMNVAAYEEKPAPTFAQALAAIKQASATRD